ncbi:SMI1/KNR4 family protein [Rhizobium binxianense]
MAVASTPHETLLTEGDVAAFEQEIGFRLPDGYRDFLLQTNGAKFPVPNGGKEYDWSLGLHVDPTPPGGGDGIGEPYFWTLGPMHGLLRKPGRYGDLRLIYRDMLNWEHLPEMLPIASEMDNSKLFLCMDGPCRNALMIAGERYVEKYNAEERITPEDYLMLASSFEEFLERLEWRYEAL